MCIHPPQWYGWIGERRVIGILNIVWIIYCIYWNIQLYVLFGIEQGARMFVRNEQLTRHRVTRIPIQVEICLSPFNKSARTLRWMITIQTGWQICSNLACCGLNNHIDKIRFNLSLSHMTIFGSTFASFILYSGDNKNAYVFIQFIRLCQSVYFITRLRILQSHLTTNRLIARGQGNYHSLVTCNFLS